GRRVGHALDHSADALAALAVGQADHGDVADLRVGVEDVLDLLGGDVLPLADDHVLEPAGEHDVAVGADVAEGAGAAPALGGAGLRGGGLVGVALEHHRALEADLAVLAGTGHRAVLGDDPDLEAGDRAADGVGELLVGVVRRALADHRALGHAVAV